MIPHWVSFWSADPSRWEYRGPWWITGVRMSDDAQSIVAAVMAEHEAHAEEIIRAAHDAGHHPIEFRFVEPRPSDWNPLDNVSGRFEPEPWMQWPFPEVQS